jgi:o-succinylbenzoate synthase
MNIETIEIGIGKILLHKPFRTALRSVESLESIIVRITTSDGMTGYGETAATEAITGDSKEGIMRAIEILSLHIVGMDLYHKAALLKMLHKRMERNFNAKSALEIALYDLWAQEADMPLYRYLGGIERDFKTGITISLNPVDRMVKDALEAVSQGFESLKVKLGDDPDADLLRVEAISQAVGQGMPLKLDANQGWSPEETVRFLSTLEQKGIPIELIEQPVKREDMAGLHYIKQRTTVPLLADESVFSPEDAKRLLEAKAVDRINIKLDKCGGISKALEIADICHMYDVECMIGCMMEGAISVGAAAHVASAKSETITMYDLDAPILCSEAPVQGGVLFDGADIRLSEKSGLGISHVDNVKWLSKIEK